MRLDYHFTDQQSFQDLLDSISDTRELAVVGPPGSLTFGDLRDGDWILARFFAGTLSCAVAARARVSAEVAHLTFEDRDWERLIASLHAPTAQVAHPATAAPPSVLVIDHDTETCQVVSALLSQAGYCTTVANSPEAAFDHLQRTDWNLLILDCQLAGKSSPTFCRRVRSDRRFANVPILFMSVRDEVEVARDSRTAGADDFIMKPFRAPELIARAGSLLSQVYGFQR